MTGCRERGAVPGSVGAGQVDGISSETGFSPGVYNEDRAESAAVTVSKGTLISTSAGERVKTLWDRRMVDELELLRSGNADAIAEVFSRHRDKLQRMVRFRLDPRLNGRVDAGDVLQDVWLETARRIEDYTSNPSVPFYVWVRQLACQIIVDLHRRHLGAQKRNVSQEVSLNRAGCDTSISIAAQLVGSLTSPSHVAMREERQKHLRAALDGMDEIDREVLALRHFEELNNNEVAQILGIRKTAASNRYVRALKRLKQVLEADESAIGFRPE